jgi:hypothetical protein
MKEKINPIEKLDTSHLEIPADHELRDKINEIIDTINKILPELERQGGLSHWDGFVGGPRNI